MRITSIFESILLQIRLSDFDALISLCSLSAIGLLVFFLMQKEFIRAYFGERARKWLRALNIVILPLLLTFGLIMAVRLWRLLQVAGLF